MNTSSSNDTTTAHFYSVGVMTMEVEGKDSEQFFRGVSAATDQFKQALSGALQVEVELHTFEGPHVTPAAGAYAPLDFLQMGMTEKLERNIHFLLIVTEVDLSSSTFTYTLALPSQITNVGVLSTKRLDPSFWGEDENDDLAMGRLATLLLHTFGHLLNLAHSEVENNVMYDFAGVEQLGKMNQLIDAQRQQMQQALPHEAHEKTSGDKHLKFTLEILAQDWRSIANAVLRANPFRLVTLLPTMITAALSVIIVLFFSAEAWDVGSTVELYQLLLFSAGAIIASTAVLYRTFAFGGVFGRGRVLAESTIVTGAATMISLLLTMLLLFLVFMLLSYLGTITIFPRKLMESWPTVDPAVRMLDHIKVCMFVAAMGVLAGSLGGRADSKDLVRAVLFVDEET